MIETVRPSRLRRIWLVVAALTTTLFGVAVVQPATALRHHRWYERAGRSSGTEPRGARPQFRANGRGDWPDRGAEFRQASPEDLRLYLPRELLRSHGIGIARAAS